MKHALSLMILCTLPACSLRPDPLYVPEDMSVEEDFSFFEPADMPTALPALECEEGETACGSSCVTLSQDTLNCGQCARTCVVPNAQAACVEGSCEVAACEPGFFDANETAEDGCESQDTCMRGAACTTSCETPGTTSCEGGVEVCAPGAETCNTRDDNCDGRCDEQAGCRVPIHRGHGPGHIFTDSMEEASAAPYSLEFASIFQLASASTDGATYYPVFLCRKGDGLTFLTTSTECERGGTRIKELGRWLAPCAQAPCPNTPCGAVPLYRLYNGTNHFYTTSEAERDNAVSKFGYRLEGMVGQVFLQP